MNTINLIWIIPASVAAGLLLAALLIAGEDDDER